MEITDKEEKALFIFSSKRTIDNCIHADDYRTAFNTMIFVLERLNNEEKTEFIDYYCKNIKYTQFVNNYGSND
jgi:hypothetical protein